MTAEEDIKPNELRLKPSLPLIGFLVIQIIIGYEWLISGLTKIINGDFPSGLADELTDKVPDIAAWYAGFFKGVVIPNAPAFGYAIEFAELLVGLALIVGPLVWLFAWESTPQRIQSMVALLIALASIGGIFMAANFHFANGSSHPWLIPQDSFDEGVDFDSLLAIFNIVTATLNFFFFSRLRETSAEAVAVPGHLLEPRIS